MILNLILSWFFTIFLTIAKSTENKTLDKNNFQPKEFKNLSKSFEHCLLEFKSILFSLFDEYNNNVESEQLIEFEFFVNQSLNVCSKTFSSFTELIDNSNSYPADCLLFIQENNGSYENCFSLLHKLVDELEDSKAFRLYKRDNTEEKKLLSEEKKHEIEQKSKKEKRKGQKVENNIKVKEKEEKKNQKELGKNDKLQSESGGTNKTKAVNLLISKSRPNDITTLLSSTVRLHTTANIGMDSDGYYDSQQEYDKEKTEFNVNKDELNNYKEDNDSKKLRMEKGLTISTVHQVIRKAPVGYGMLATLISYTKYCTVSNSFVDFKTVTSNKLTESDTTTTGEKKTVLRKIREKNIKARKISTILYDVTAFPASRISITKKTTETTTLSIVNISTDPADIVPTRVEMFTTCVVKTASTITNSLSFSSKIYNLLGILGSCSPPNAAATVAVTEAKYDFNAKLVVAESLSGVFSSLSPITQSEIYAPALRYESAGDSSRFDFHQYNFSTSVNQEYVGYSNYNFVPWVSTWLYLLFISIAVVMVM